MMEIVSKRSLGQELGLRLIGILDPIPPF